MGDSWAACIPWVEEDPTYIQVLKGSIHAGTFVQYEFGSRVGRFVKVSTKNGSDALAVNVFIPLLESKLRVSPITHCTMHKIQELVQTSEIVEIEADEVTNVAFVFLSSDFQEDKVYGCQGMHNIYQTRYRTDGKELSHSMFKAFPSEFPCFASRFCDDYAFRQFHALRRLRKHFAKLMGRWSYRQGDFVYNRAELTVSREFWAYILNHISIVEPNERKLKRKKIERILEPGFLLKSIRNEFEMDNLHFESSSELQEVTSLLGELVLFEVRKARAPLAEAQSLLENDAMNVIIPFEGRKPGYVEGKGQ